MQSPDAPRSPQGLLQAEEAQALRDASASDPGAFWEAITARELHWFVSGDNLAARGEWLCKQGSEQWTGWNAEAEEVCIDAASVGWSYPWRMAVDAHAAPFVRWFAGASTNAAFNEVDRHILAGHQDAEAFIEEPEGAGEAPRFLTLGQLLLQSTLAAHAMRRSLHVKRGDRVIVYMPNCAASIVWIEAAKRIGAPVCGVAAGTAPSALADRIMDVGAAVLVTASSGDTYEMAVAAMACCSGHGVQPQLVLIESTPGAAEPGVAETPRAAGPHYHSGKALIAASWAVLSSCAPRSHPHPSPAPRSHPHPSPARGDPW